MTKRRRSRAKPHIQIKVERVEKPPGPDWRPMKPLELDARFGWRNVPAFPVEIDTETGNLRRG